MLKAMLTPAEWVHTSGADEDLFVTQIDEMMKYSSNFDELIRQVVIFGGRTAFRQHLSFLRKAANFFQPWSLAALRMRENSTNDPYLLAP